MQKLYFICLCLVYSICTSAQQVSTTDSTENHLKGDKDFKLRLMPFINYNRNLEFMFGVIPMAMYHIDKSDTISPKSLSGLSGVYTTNGSYVVALFNRFYFDQDRWRATLYLVTGDHISQMYVDDAFDPGFYDYDTQMFIISAGIQRRLLAGLFWGIGYTHAYYDSDFEDEIRPGSITQSNGVELNLQLDTRKNVYYPMQGKKAKLRLIMNPEWLSNEFASNRIKCNYNQYFPSRDDQDVIAARFAGSFGIGDIAFEQQVTIGGKDIRGYSEGKYRGDGLMAVQGEYRYNFRDNMGLVGFAGLSTIYGSDTESFNWKLYPGIGAGYRYAAFKDVKFNIGLDAALGKDDWGIYFRIGEAF